MDALHEYGEDTDHNNLLIARALRDIDEEVLVTALVGVDEKLWQPFLRNLSKAGRSRVLEAIELKTDRTSPARTEAAQEVLAQIIARNAKYAYGEERPRPAGPPPRINLNTLDDIIESFKALTGFALRHGLLSLEPAEESIDDMFMRKGLQLVLSGWDPLSLREVLEHHKQAYLRSVELKLDLMLDGLLSIQSADLPAVLEEKLRARIPPR